MTSFVPSPSVPTFTLNDGAKFPILQWGNGTGNAKKEAVQAGSWVLKYGIRAIDTAQGYGREPETGEVVRDSGLKRNQVWITTKLSQEDGAADKDPIPVEEVKASVLNSIKLLGTQPDLILVHNPFVAPKGKLVEFWKALEALKDSGDITGSLGVSNFRPQDFEELLPVAKYKPVCNQIEYHPLVLTHLEPVLKITNVHNILTTAFGPLTPALRHPTKGGGPLKPVLERIAKRIGEDFDPANVLLLWTRATGVGIITASANEERIKGFAQIQEMLLDPLGGLTKDEVSEITQIGKKYHFRGYEEHMKVDFPAPNLPAE
ncbi:conjugated polyketone reductase C1 [Meredithblackwellia eburnea MCA 4105]